MNEPDALSHNSKDSLTVWIKRKSEKVFYIIIQTKSATDLWQEITDFNIVKLWLQVFDEQMPGGYKWETAC